MKKLRSKQEFEKLKEEIKARSTAKVKTVIVCGGTGCLSNGSAELAEIIRKKIRQKRLKARVELKMSGGKAEQRKRCRGFS